MVAEANPEQLVGYARKGHVATITLNRPDKRNAFNADLVRSLQQALTTFDGDPEARVAILCGAGNAFSSGADVQERQMRTPEEFARLGGPQEPDAHTGDLLVRSVNWKPVIAAVHGAVMGLGLGVAFECDLVIADVDTRFQITETPRGLGGARFWSLLHTCGGAAFATEVALTGRFFSAHEARAAGLVCRVAPEGRAVVVALELASAIAANPPLSVQSTVRIRRWLIAEAQRLAVAFTEPMKLYLTEDFKEAVAAHVEKRAPRPFKGR